jgi:enterochelin esterase-like enzyme
VSNVAVRAGDAFLVSLDPGTRSPNVLAAHRYGRSVPSTATHAGPVVDATGVTFRLPDIHARLRGVRLYQDLRASGDRIEFRHRGGAWVLRFPRPKVDRMEYLLELEHPNGGRQTIPDPTNSLRVPGAFGEKSVVEFPGYRRPRWLDQPPVTSTTVPLALSARDLGATVGAELWSPDTLAADAPAPLLIVHDGPEYATLGSFLQYTAALIESGSIKPLRVALLAPGDRNRWYAVNPAYARALTRVVVAQLDELVPSTIRIGVGASLGALAMLHAHRLAPNTFDGLFLQSGSFFTPELDPQERRFSRYRAVTRFVTDLVQAVADPHPVPTVLTCGATEENLGNNRLMADTLTRLGYPTQLHELRDLHNYTAWRDALDPWLTRLIATVDGAHAS